MTIKEFERQLPSLTFVEKTEILRLLVGDFAMLASEHHVVANGAAEQPSQLMLTPDDFELLVDQLADEFTEFTNPSSPALSDYAISRAGIYEDHD